MAGTSSNKIIAKNTVLLYTRMLFVMLISLYTSRVILQKLGIDDYGIYQTVGGIVGLLSFINGALSSGTSRFLTFELGRNDKEKLRKTFSTTLTVHICIAIMVVVLAETFGYWFLYNKLLIPVERLNAAIFVFHISIITAVFTLTQVPYTAVIIAHEQLSVFAYIGIFEVVAKLLILYLLNIGNCDKLILYAIMLFFVQLLIVLFYRIYCHKKYEETKYSFFIDKQIFKSVAGFSSWSLIASGSSALNNQGILMLLNMFFSPAVVAARAISIQVNMAVNQLVTNFRTAVNPQIVKRYASGDYAGSMMLLLTSTKYSYYLSLLICLPLFFLVEPLLKYWLSILPEFTVVFVKLIIVQALFQVFDTSFYTALYAKGRLRENALISPVLGLLQFPLVYALFKMGYSPILLSWVNLCLYALLGLVVKPILLVRIVGYKWADIGMVFKSCVIVTICALPFPLLLVYFVDVDSLNILRVIVLVVFLALVVVMSVYFVGIDKKTRTAIKSIIVRYFRL